MVEVIRRKRRSPILTPSSIPCLKSLPTINITQGCALGCAYCYIQGYAQYPGPDRVILFENTAELVKDELSRKRRPPARVYFSPSSDAFQYLPEVQEVAAATMTVLLNAGVEVSFLTKGFISERFLRLFASAPQLVFAQIGITTLDAGLWKRVEPRTAPPQARPCPPRPDPKAGFSIRVPPVETKYSIRYEDRDQPADFERSGEARANPRTWGEIGLVRRGEDGPVRCRPRRRRRYDRGKAVSSRDVRL